MSKFFIDTEFIENGFTIDLLSIAIVHESGDSYYAVSSEADYSLADDWVKNNVLPGILRKGDVAKSRLQIKTEVQDFINSLRGDKKPEIWGYYADYDWVAFCQLFGKMIDLPKGWPMYCRDIKQLCDEVGNPRLPSNDAHHALTDALWIKTQYEYLRVKKKELIKSLILSVISDQYDAKELP